MRKAILLVFFIVAANFIFLSVGYGQTNVNVHAVVPQTEFNKAGTLPQVTQPTTKENKYLYFFEKSLGLQSGAINNGALDQAETGYDKLAAWVSMWAVVIFFALIFLIILRLIDLYLLASRRK